MRRWKVSSMRPGSARTPGRPNPPASSPGVRAPGQLQQRQRVASGLRDDLLAHPGIDRPGQHRVEQRPRVRARQPLDHQLRQPGQLLGRDPGRRRPAPPTPCPAGAPRRPGPGPRPGPATARHPPRKPAGDLLRPPPAGSAQPGRPGTGPAPDHRAARRVIRSASRCGAGSTFKLIEDGCAQLVQRRERELHLRLDGRDANDAASAARRVRYSSSAVLPTPASPRITRERLSPRRRASKEGIQFAALRVAANQSHCSSPRRRMRRLRRHNRMLGA